MFRLILTVVSLTILTLPSSSRASTIDDAGAEQLQQMLSAMIENIRDAYAASQITVKTEGDLVIEQASGYYAATLPYLSMQGPEGGRTDIGIVAINAVPDSEDGRWKMSVALPTPITVYDDNNKRTATINIGKQRFSGLWDQKITYFTEMDAAYEDITADIMDADGSVTIDKTKWHMSLKDSGDNLWSGPFNITMNDLKVNAEKADTSFSIQEIGFTGNMKDFNPDGYSAYMEQMKTLGQKIQAEGPDDLSMETQKDLFNALFDFYTQAMESFTSQITAKDLVFKSNADGEPINVTLKSIGYGFDMLDLNKDTSGAAVRIGFSGLKTEPLDQAMKDIIPDYLTLDFNISKIPTKALGALAKTSMESGNTDNAEQQALPLLKKAGTTFSIDKNGFGNSVYNFQTSGNVVASDKSPFSALINLKTEISGMQALVDLLQANSANAPPAIQGQIQGAIQALTFVSMFGQNETNSAGREVKVYDITTDENGAIMMNGNDLTQMMGGMR